MSGRAPTSEPSVSKTREVGGITLHLSTPDATDQSWIGQDAVLRQLLACWLVVDPRDLPLSPRLTGPPGIGKTTLAMAAARLRKQPLFINQCTADTRPEDLIVTPVLAEKGTIAYHASPLVSAMLVGGVCVLDEGNRMNEKSWASLAPLLDHRRYVESIVAGITDPRAPRLPGLRHDERGRVEPTRSPTTSSRGSSRPWAWDSRPRRRDGDPEVSPPVRRERAPGADRGIPPAGPPAQAGLLAARRDQPAEVRRQADGAGPPASARPRRRLARGPLLRPRRRGRRPREPGPQAPSRHGRPARPDGPRRPLLRPRRPAAPGPRGRPVRG